MRDIPHKSRLGYNRVVRLDSVYSALVYHKSHIGVFLVAGNKRCRGKLKTRVIILYFKIVFIKLVFTFCLLVIGKLLP